MIIIIINNKNDWKLTTLKLIRYVLFGKMQIFANGI